MKKNILTLLFCALCLVAFAQQAPVKLPIDSAVRVGKLDNGLTYYIRHNEYPKQRVEFHIAQAVGAILEEDHQNGLAHFLEHMAFNGTKHFEGKGIINYFEANGVSFGGNINAYTSIDQTVYRLSDVPNREGLIDSALLVLHDWSCDLLLLPEEIDNERGVIREEWRTGNTASRRNWKRTNEILYAGTQYAKRDVIGDTAVINNFSYDALRAYYEKWYGPDLQALIIVGDIDVDQIEQKIVNMFDTIPARANRGERPYYELPDNEEPIIAIITDKETQRSVLEIDFKHDQLAKELLGTYMNYTFNVTNSLIRRMLNERFTEIVSKPSAPITNGGCGYYQLVKTKDCFEGWVTAKEGQEKEAFQLLLTEIEKMHRYGFTEAELERAKQRMLASYETSYKERNNRENDSYVDDYLGNFLDGDAIPGIEWEYMYLQKLLPQITLEQINKHAHEYITDNNILVSVVAPEKETVVLPTEDEIRAALKEMHNLDIQAPEAEKVITTLVNKLPKAGKIKKTAYNECLGTTEWTLSNGIRVIIKPTEFMQDDILMTGTSEGGYSAVLKDPTQLPSMSAAASLISYSGLGEFSYPQLRKALAGKIANVRPSIGYYGESIDGSTTIKDFETMLQLTYLNFTAIREDHEAFQTMINSYENSIRNKASNPKAVFSDSISAIANDHSPLSFIWDTATVAQIDEKTAYKFFRERFSNPADFTFYFTGNINPEDAETQRLICTYLGGLKTKRCRETYKDLGIRSPKGIVKNYFDYPMTTRTASNRIQYTGNPTEYSLDLSLNMHIIGEILSTRYLESIREREGGSYGVGCSGYLSLRPDVRPILIMQFDTDPEKQARLMEIIHEEIQTIIENGPLASDLEKERQIMLNRYEERLEKNGYWDGTVLPCYYRREHSINYITDYKAAVERITAETVQETLRKLVADGNMFEVVMLPE